MTSERMHLLWVSRSDFPSGQFIRAHAHEGFFHLFYALEGEATFCVENELILLTPGALLLAGIGRTHEMKHIVSGGVRLIELKFSMDDGPLRDALMRRGAGDSIDERGAELIRSIANEASGDEPYAREIMSALLCALVHLLARDACAQPAGNGFSRATGLALRYMDKHFQHEISLEDIAGASGMNRNYVCTVFKRETGVSTNEYLNMLRVSRAAQLLQYGDVDVAGIAVQCGFTNPSHFSRTFKRYAGILPSQCRQLFYTSVVDIKKYRSGGDAFQKTVPSEALARVEQTLKRLQTAPHAQA